MAQFRAAGQVTFSLGRRRSEDSVGAFRAPRSCEKAQFQSGFSV
jgi:hypothetical protein